MNDAFLKDALEYVAAPESDVSFVLRHRTSSARGKRLYDAIVAGGFQRAEIAAIKRDSDKADLVRDQVRRRNRTMTAEAIQNLVDAVLHGAPLMADVSTGRPPLEVILGIYESGKTGNPCLF